MGEVLQINCHNCVGACCRTKIMMRLTQVEADFLIEGGTVLETVVEPYKAREAYDYNGNDPVERERKWIARDLATDPRLNRFGAFLTRSDCGYLQPNPTTGVMECSVYSDPRKPRGCSDFIVDSTPCNNMRRDAGVTARVEVLPRRRHS